MSLKPGLTPNWTSNQRSNLGLQKFVSNIKKRAVRGVGVSARKKKPEPSATPFIAKSGTKWSCTFCGDEFKEKQYASKHIRKHHKAEFYAALDQNEKPTVEHNQKPKVVKQQPKTIKKKRHSFSQFIRREDDRKWCCTFCEYESELKMNTSRHIMDYHMGDIDAAAAEHTGTPNPEQFIKQELVSSPSQDTAQKENTVPTEDPHEEEQHENASNFSLKLELSTTTDEDSEENGGTITVNKAEIADLEQRLWKSEQKVEQMKKALAIADLKYRPTRNSIKLTLTDCKNLFAQEKFETYSEPLEIADFQWWLLASGKVEKPGFLGLHLYCIPLDASYNGPFKFDVDIQLRLQNVFFSKDIRKEASGTYENGGTSAGLGFENVAEFNQLLISENGFMQPNGDILAEVDFTIKTATFQHILRDV